MDYALNIIDAVIAIESFFVVVVKKSSELISQTAFKIHDMKNIWYVDT